MKVPRLLGRFAVVLSLLVVDLPAARAAEKIYEVEGRVVRPEKVSGSNHLDKLVKVLNANRRSLGVFIFQAVIRRDGTVGKIEVLRPRKVSREIEEALHQEVGSWRFKPATLDGRPVAVYYTMTLNICPH